MIRNKTYRESPTVLNLRESLVEELNNRLGVKYPPPDSVGPLRHSVGLYMLCFRSGSDELWWRCFYSLKGETLVKCGTLRYTLNQHRSSCIKQYNTVWVSPFAHIVRPLLQPIQSPLPILCTFRHVEPSLPQEIVDMIISFVYSQTDL